MKHQSKHKAHLAARHHHMAHAHKAVHAASHNSAALKHHKLTQAETEKIMKEKIEKNPEKCYQLVLHSKHLPFSVVGADFKKVTESELKLQDFVRLVEKKFDAIWYIGPDYIGNEMFERFMFHHGGLMEISLNGRIKCFFVEDKCEKMEKALFYAVKKMSSENMAKNMKREIKIGQKLISLRNSLLKEAK